MFTEQLLYVSGDKAANKTWQCPCLPGVSILVERKEIDKIGEEIVLDWNKHQGKNQGRRMGSTDKGTILEMTRKGSLNRLEGKRARELVCCFFF